MTERDLVRRLVKGETLEGGEARVILDVLESEVPWRFGVRIALAHLDAGEVEKAKSVLEQLLDDQGGHSVSGHCT